MLDRESVIFQQLQAENVDLLAQFFVELSSEPYFQPHPFTPEAAQQICADDTDFYGGGFFDSKLVAYGFLRWAGHEHPSLGIAISEPFRGLGLSRELMQFLHTAAKTRRSEKIRLRVHPENAAALSLYKDLGYSFSGELDRNQLVGWYLL